MGCRRRAPQADLVRVVRAGDGSLVMGRALPGRGAWLCAGSVECVDLAHRRRAFARALRAPVADEAIVSLRENMVGRATMDGPHATGGTGSEIESGRRSTTKGLKQHLGQEDPGL